MRATLIAFLLLAAGTLPGCIFADFDVKLFEDYTAPLKEFTLSGDGDSKIAIVAVSGVLNNKPAESFVFAKPSMVKETVARLGKAASDRDVKALLLKVDSPGGSVTASDILHHEIVKFKTRRPDVKIVVAMMDVAASGGYYIAAAGHRIVAHPTTVTGSIGVIFVRPDLSGLLEMIGTRTLVTKSGPLKDMGSPFRPATDEENKLFQNMIDEYYDRFVDVVVEGRGLPEDRVRAIADGRIYTGRQAMELGLVDRIGYLNDAVDEARAVAGLDDQARLVVYRRSETADQSAENMVVRSPSTKTRSLIDLGLDRLLPCARTGFYYLWLPEM